MVDFNQATLGLFFIILGLILVLLTLSALRLIPRSHLLNPNHPSPTDSKSSLIENQDEAILVIQNGGRLVYLNRAARELFDDWEPDVNLESLARRVHPSQLFLKLCAGDGPQRFTLNSRNIEGSPILLPGYIAGDGYGRDMVLVSMHRSGLFLTSSISEAGIFTAKEGIPAAGSSHGAFAFFTELAATMTSSLNLEDTLQAILASIDQLFPSDLIEISTWDEEAHRLTAYRLIGHSGFDYKLERLQDGSTENRRYFQHILTTHEPLLINNTATFEQAQPTGDRFQFPFQSYLGVPLIFGGRLVGILELASLKNDHYHQDDLDLILMLAGQAAAALNNALLFRDEQRRSTELGGLTNLAQTVSSLHDPQDLYNRLVESIAPLLDVEIFGFLIYDENRQMLKAQEPFVGLQPNVLEWYQTLIQPGSPAEALWRARDAIVVTDAPQDERIQAFGLHHLALAAGIRHTVLMPLSSAGRDLGYLQAASKRDGTAFDSNDLRILAIIAGQAAPIIDNAELVQQSKQRAQRAETLRRIASLTSSSATLDEILKFSLIDLARLLQADSAALFILDEGRGELRLHRNSVFGLSAEIAGRIGRVSIDDPQFPLLVSGSGNFLLESDLQGSTRLPFFYYPIMDDARMRSAVGVPLVIQERIIGELFVASLKSNAFSTGDAQILATIAGQLASAIERARLYSQTDQSLRTRVDQLVALTRVSRELNTTLKLEDLLKRVYDEVLLTTQSDCGSVLLLDLNTPQTPNIMPPINLQFGDEHSAGLDPVEQSVLLQGETVIIENFEAVDSGTTPYKGAVAPAHTGILSAMITPIGYQGQVAGLIHLHSKSAGHFGPAEREIAEALAIQAAIALGNAQRYSEQQRRSEQLNRRVQTLSRIFEVSQVMQAEGPMDDSLETIVYALQSTTPFEVVLISVYNPERGLLERHTGAGIPLPDLDMLRANPVPWSDLEPLLKPEYRIGQTFFVPVEKGEILPPSLISYITTDKPRPSENGHSWKPNDVLMLPLFDHLGKPLGLISVDAPRDAIRPDPTTIETLEIFGSQAALVIETNQKVQELHSQLDRISNDLDIARLSADKAQHHLPDLLHKDLEQTLAIHHLDRRARRIRAGLDITEMVSRQTSAADVLLTLGREMLTRMEFDAVLIAEGSESNPTLIHSIGFIPSEVNPKALLGQRNPLRHSIQTGEIVLAASLPENAEWYNSPLLRALDTKGFVCLPIKGTPKQPSRRPGLGGLPSNRRPSVALLAISRAPVTEFTVEDHRLFDLIIRQASIALQNLSLQEATSQQLREVNLLLDFSRRLGSLDPSSILNTLVESALNLVPNAQMAMVALWDTRLGALIPQASAGYADEAELLTIRYRPGEGVPGLVFNSQQPLNLDVVDFAHHYNLSQENLLAYRNATGGRLPVSCLAVPIRTGSRNTIAPIENEAENLPSRSHPMGVLVLDSPVSTSAFVESDLAVTTSLAQQTALTLENARLYQASRQRSNQLQALTSAATTITSSLQSQELITSLLEQLRAILPFNTGTLWLREKRGGNRKAGGQSKRMIIQGVTGFADGDERVGLTVDIDDSPLLSEMIETGRPIWVPDVRQDARFRALTMENELSNDQAGGFEFLSWLGMPLIASGQVTGVIALEKTEIEAYTSDDVQLAFTFAGQAAVALENAELYEDSVERALELDRRTQILSTLNRLSAELSGSLNADSILDVTIQEFQLIMNCTMASVLLPHRDGNPGHYVLQAQYPPLMPKSPYQPGISLPETLLLDRLGNALGIFSTENIAHEPELAPLMGYLAWNRTQSLLIVPIASGGGESGSSERNIHGMLLACDQDLHHFSSESLDLARTISNQVAIALQNARLLEETLGLTEDLELRVAERTAELGRERQRAETLLRIITELSASLDLEHVLHRTLTVLSEYVDAAQITILISRPGESKLQRLAQIGYTPAPDAAGSPTPFDIDQGLAGWIISQRQPVLVADVLSDERWIRIDYPNEDLKPSHPHRAAIGVPLMSGAEALGCLLLFHPEVDHFTLEQLHLVQAAANQVSVAVNNAELYRLIRDQAEDLGTMLRHQQIETSRSKAILEAVADGVLVTDSGLTITLFNESAEKILGLERSDVVGQSMEHFSGLFGRATRRWMEKIEAWTENPAAYQPGDTFAEQIILEDGRVIFVHLAPVSLRNDFLGTVSIFQDITHQVEVDRLKSEFVATVSHELRTPMTSIKGYVDILLLGAAGELSDQQKHFLEVVKSNAERLAILVNDLLDISQIEAGRLTLALQPVNLVEIAEMAIEDLERRTTGETKNVSIEKEYAGGLPRALADPERIRRVIDNLLDNAFQYNLPEGRIILRIAPYGDEVRIDIHDTGVGVHPRDQGHVFERFFRGDNTLTLGVAGTGLGLSIVKNLVTMQNGRIWMESSGIYGAGSTFSFTLPVYRPSETTEHNQEESWQKY